MLVWREFCSSCVAEFPGRYCHRNWSCGSGMTCWRRLRDWQEAGIWQLIHFSLLDWLARYGEIDWSRAVVDGSSWGRQTGPNPTDRAKLGSKRHLICDGRGVPLAIQLTGANRNDSQQALALVDAIPTLQGERGRHGIVLTAYWATVVTTLSQSGKVCVTDASFQTRG